jgi:Zn-dependent peptidase ImmA (M78 family)
VLINRREVPGRRHFDLAHELFHILTWDAMTPEHIEEATETGGPRIEQLANSFASAVLMPTTVLDRFGEWAALGSDELVKKLNRVADELRVTASALKWRLVALRHITRARAQEMPDAAPRNNGRTVAKVEPPPLFSKPFVEVIARALDDGRISARRAADLLDLALDDLPDLFRKHGIEATVEL